jgi:hypothetical protein
MAATLSTGKPTHCAVVNTYAPYLIFNYKADQAYVVRYKYLSKKRRTHFGWLD